MGTRMIMEVNSGFKQVGVCITDHGFSWSFYNDGFCCTNEIQTHQILQPIIEPRTDDSRLIVQYVRIIVPDRKKKKIQARLKELVFFGLNSDCETIKSQIDALIQHAEPQRPKHVLLFVNPKSGFGTAVRDYYEIVAPLMSRCGIVVDAVVTKSATTAADVLESYDLSSIDVVAAMGGDGSVGQLTNALIRRTMKDAHADIDDPNTPLIAPSVPFAAIPGGSGCVVAMLATGTVMDIETAVMALILGRTTQYDVIGTTHNGRSLSYANLVVGCGVFSNSNLWMEKVKWMGRHRYWLTIPRSWWTWRQFVIEIDYLPVPEDERTIRLDADCATKRSDVIETPGPWPGWKTVRCRAVEMAMSADSVRDMTRKFFTGEYGVPDVMTGRAIVDVYVGTLWESLKASYALYKHGRNRVPSRYIYQIEGTAFRVRSVEEWRENDKDLLIHVDGEAASLPDGAVFETRVHTGLLSVVCLNPDLVSPALETQLRGS